MPGMHVHDGEKFVPVGGGDAMFDVEVIRGRLSKLSSSTYVRAVFEEATERVGNVKLSYPGESNAFNGLPLAYIPEFEVEEARDTLGMFQASGIVNAPWFDTSKVTVTESMFAGCASLVSIPNYDFSSVRVASLMFDSATAIESVTLDLPSVARVTGMFRNCTNLRTVDIRIPDGNLVGYIADVFRGCKKLESIPAIDLSGATNISSFAPTGTGTAPSSLTSFEAFGFTRPISLKGNQLSADAINVFFENAGEAFDSRYTLDVSDNPGSATCDPSIATAKGWQVTV